MTELEKNVILIYADNNMDISKTARAAKYHRNSIVYWLEKIKEKYGLNPRNFYDLIRLVEMAKGGAE